MPVKKPLAVAGWTRGLAGADYAGPIFSPRGAVVDPPMAEDTEWVGLNSIYLLCASAPQRDYYCIAFPDIFLKPRIQPEFSSRWILSRLLF